jgi:anti-sigma-K factor RskA
MNEKEKEKMLELLSDKAFNDLTEADLAEIRELEKLFPELKDDDSFELAASAVSLTNLNAAEPLPAHLRARILAEADKYFAAPETAVEKEEEFQKTFAFEAPRRTSFMSWLGWALAAAACVALAVNLWLTRIQPPTEIVNKTPEPAATPKPAEPTLVEQREQLLAAADAIKTVWTNPKQPSEIIGDVVWSNSAQKGFMRFRALPANDPNVETYQLWIIDKTQKHPIDGGVFDVTAAGEIIIPIDAKIKVKEPTTFAVTAEKPGGVVVSAQEKVLALAKVVT